MLERLIVSRRCQLSSPVSVINFWRSAQCWSHPPSRSVFNS